MSLRQQGSQTAKNRKMKTPGRRGIQSATPPKAEKPKRDAQVLSKTWPAWGNLVVGRQ